MKNRIITGLILMLTAVLPFTGCESPPPPVTDGASFIENLEYAGATVNVTGTDEHTKPFAGQYVDFRHQTIEGVQDSGKTIEPEFLESEINHLSDIQEQADNIEITSTEILLNGAKIRIREYDSAASAAWDAAYIAPTEDFDLTIPTDEGDVDIVISPLGIELYAYKTGRIIVEYYSVKSCDESVLSLLESILGPPFYEY